MTDSAPLEASGLAAVAQILAARHGGVPRDTLGEPISVSRHYHSPARSVKGVRTSRRIVEAALALVGEGNFRPTLAQVAARAEVGTNRINAHFGYIHLLWRVLAREHAGAVAEAAGLPDDLHPGLRTDLVWVIMTGATRATWEAREGGAAS